MLPLLSLLHAPRYAGATDDLIWRGLPRTYSQRGSRAEDRHGAGGPTWRAGADYPAMDRRLGSLGPSGGCPARREAHGTVNRDFRYGPCSLPHRAEEQAPVTPATAFCPFAREMPWAFLAATGPLIAHVP